LLPPHILSLKIVLNFNGYKFRMIFLDFRNLKLKA
jgi:hypothetical protein